MGVGDDGLENSGGVRVSFTVKELLGQINSSLTAINTKLDLKAEYRDVESLAKRLDTQSERVTELFNRVTLTEKLAGDRERRGAAQFTKLEKYLGLLLAASAIFAPIIFHHGVL